MKRLFVAFELPQTTLDSINVATVSFVKKIPLDARLVKWENLHITISFLGDQDEAMIPGILDAMKGTTIPESLYIQTNAIDYGPPAFEKRMVWLSLTKETSKELEFIKLSLEANLYRNGIQWTQENSSHFNGHITLARFNPKPRERLETIYTPFDASFHPTELVLFESELTPQGPNYYKIEN
ncbi:RNA 2',3'-cyclic phosphodiesterase [Candidatus Parcubacteria bacterium]|jgi:2'-5' RNA ligase|nr:MAG: RNA 2',3'-cyclic phosphodiesterase [Candidatus Parcubacteria bacterium]